MASEQLANKANPPSIVITPHTLSTNDVSDVRISSINGTSGMTQLNSPDLKETKQSETAKGPEPFFYCKLVANRPGLSFGLALAGHVLLGVISGSLLLAGYDLFPTNFDTLPLQLADRPYYGRDFAFRYRNNYTGRVPRVLSYMNIPKYRYAPGEGVEMIYDTGTGNIFDRSHLMKIRDIEAAVTESKNYDNYCQLMKVSGVDMCMKPLSVLRFFDGTYAHINVTFNDSNFDNIAAVLHLASVTNETKGIFQYTLALKHVISQSKVSASLTRSLLLLGIPVKNVKSYKDEIKIYFKDYLKPSLEKFKDVSQFEFLYFNYDMMLADVRDQALLDMMLAIGSVVFIWSFMCYHTRSIFITSLAVYSILSSFLGTNLIYRVVLDFRYFGFFHILAIFIVLGIGADDLFVFYDSWRATAFKSYPSLAHRLSDAYRKSALSMLVTSVTTMFAFIASAVSPLLATKSFGIFSGILVIINYLSVIIFFPTVVVFYHKYFHKYDCCCCNVCNKTESSAEIKLDVNNRLANGHCETKPQEAVGKKRPIVVRYFRDYHFRFVTNKYAKWVIICLFLSIVGFFGYETSRLVPESEQLQLYQKSHNYAKAIHRNLYSFVPNEVDQFISIYLVWGLKERDLSGCHFSAVDCRGSQVFDDEFDANTPEAQAAFKKLCNELSNFSDKQIEEYKIRRDVITGLPEIACFTRNMEAYLQTDPASSVTSLNLPWDWNKTASFIGAKSSLYHSHRFNSSFSSFLDIPLTYWLYDGFSMRQTADFTQFNPLFGEVSGPFTQRSKGRPTAKVGNRLKYVAVEINTTLNGQSLSYSDGIPVVERWEEFMKKQVSKMPDPLKGGFQTVKMIWQWVYIQKALVDNAILGIVVGLCLAFPVLTLATQNFIIGFVATVCIGCVTVCVIGVIPLAGWKLGVLVSLNMCLVVGLSVDYIVHLAEGYHLSEHKDRRSRVQDTLESMGVSVFSGACTTLGASFFMLFAEIQFFFQFGIFMFCTIGFSLIFSLGLFVTVLALVGPNDDQGDFYVFIKKYICKKRSSITPRESNSSNTAPETLTSHL